MERQDAGSLLEKGYKKMDKKKIREAIEDFQKLAELFQNKDSVAIEHCNTAIEALEKQLLKKPEKVVSAIYGTSYECKNCGSEIEPLDIYADYCKWCGQRLDWSES